VDLEAEAALGRPFGHLPDGRGGAFPRREHLDPSGGAVMHAPHDQLAGTDDPQPVIAEMTRQHLEEALQVVRLLAGILAVEIERNTDRQVAVAPHAIERIVVVRKHAAARRIDDAGHPDARERLEERPDAGHLAVETDLGDAGEQPREGEEIAAHHPGRLAVLAAFQLAGGRHLGVVVEAELRHAGRTDDGVIVEVLDVDRCIGHGLRQLLGRRAALLGELRLVPATANHHPGAGPRLRGLRQTIEPLRERRDFGPVGLHRVGEAGAHRMDMRVDQAGNDRASAEIDHLGVGTHAAPHGLVVADRDDRVLPDGERARDGGGGIERHDAPVREHQVLGMAGRDGCQGPAQGPACRHSIEVACSPPLRFPGS
jgi:hypothetical protein